MENPDSPLREHWWHPVPFDIGKDRFHLTDYFSEGAFCLSEPRLSATPAVTTTTFGVASRP